MKCIVLVGLPCSGKSTLCKKSSELMKVPYLSSGDIARGMAKNSKAVEEDLKNGNMAPEDEMRDCVIGFIRHNYNVGCKVVLLDGFPRNIDQLKWIEGTLYDYVDEIILIHVSISIAEAYRRARERGRYDDTSINKRVGYFVEETYPMLREVKNVHMILNEGPKHDDGPIYNMCGIIQREVFDNAKYSKN